MRRAVAVTITAVAALLTASCVRQTRPAPMAASPDARVGGHLVVGIVQPHAIAPWLTSSFDQGGSLIARTLCDSLVAEDPVTGETRMALAETARQQRAGSVVVRLREGLRFSDGRTAHAEDVVASLSLAANADVASPAAGVVAPILGADALGDPAKLAVAEEREAHPRLAGLVSASDHNLEIGLADTASAGRAGYLRALGHPVFAPVPKSTVDDPTAAERAPVCVGPYELAAPWEPGQGVINLRRSKARYYARNDGHTRGGAGWFDTIELRVFPDAETLYQEYGRGTLDVASVPGTRVTDARTRFGDDVVLAPTGTVTYVGLPTNVRPFDDQTVRAALSLALDRRALVAEVFGGAALPATGFLPPTLEEGTTDRPTGAGTSSCASLLRTGAPDVGAARRMLADRGIDLGGQRINLAFNDEFQNRALVEEVARQWEAAFGLDIQTTSADWEQYLSQLRQPAGTDGAYRWSWTALYPDPDQYLAPLFGSANIGTDNLSRFDDTSFDSAIKRARGEENAALRTSRIQLAENILCTELPMVPVTFGQVAHLVRKQRVGSALPTFTDRTTGLPLLRDLYAHR